MAESMHVSEVLCYLVCYRGTVPSTQLSSVISGFYTDNEIEIAKKLLYDCIKQVSDNLDIGRYEIRKGENKRQSNVSDIMKMYAIVDVNKVKLLIFVARNLKRLPRINPSDADLVSVTTSLTTVQNKLDDLIVCGSDHTVSDNFVERLNKLEEVQMKCVRNIEEINTSMLSIVSGATKNAALLRRNEDTENKYQSMEQEYNKLRVKLPDLGEGSGDCLREKNMIPKKSWSDVAIDKDDRWHTVNGKKNKLPKCVMGTKKYSDDSGKVKASGHVHGWHVYIGNLDKVTTSNMIEDQLSSEGIKMILCKIYKHKESAAAHVIISFDKKDAILNADTWTEGVRVRN